MADREKTCILCGKKDIMHGYICTDCQDKIQREVVSFRREKLKQAEQAGKKRGADPEEDN